jgi:hypothetical protein
MGALEAILLGAMLAYTPVNCRPSRIAVEYSGARRGALYPSRVAASRQENPREIPPHPVIRGNSAPPVVAGYAVAAGDQSITG